MIGLAESIIFKIFVLWRCVNCRGSLNRRLISPENLIKSQLKLNLFIALRLKFRSARGASHDLAFIVLALIKGMTKGGESKIFFCYLRDLRASPYAYRERGSVI